MVLDTSALLAILFGEPEAPAMLRAIAASENRWLGSPTHVEASVVLLAKKGSGGEVALDALLERLGIEIVDLTPVAARLARLGYARYGRGIGDPAVLNLGDCFAYGVALSLGAPLLFKGTDFRRTDVRVAEY